MAVASDLITRAQRLADMEDSNYVSSDEWMDYLNEGLSDLHDILVSKAEDYALTSTTINLVSGTDTYSLPNDFYKLRGLDLQQGGGTRYTLRPFNFRERNRRQYSSGLIDPGYVYQYLIQGTDVRFIPVPSSSGEVATLWYVPQVAVLSGSFSSIPSYIPAGYERFVVMHMTARALQKESDPGADRMLMEREAERRRIESIAANRDSGEPKRMVDVRYQGADSWPWGYR